MSQFAYEQTLISYMNNIKNSLLNRPLILGGVTSSGGGAGGPPGGFLGQIPQTRVTFDTSELAVWDYPVDISGYPSGVSLLNNLNRLRYRLDQLEAASSANLTFYNDGVIVVSGVTSFNFMPGISGEYSGGMLNIYATTTSGSGHTIQDEGVAVTSRSNLNFIGDSVTVVDDSVNDRTNVTITVSGTSSNIGSRVYKDSNTTISNNTPTALTFNQERYDNGSLHDTVTNSSRFTIGTDGTYLISGNVRWAANMNGDRTLEIRVGGSTIIAGQKEVPVLEDVIVMNVTTLYYLTSTQYVELYVTQTSGGDLVVSSTGNYSPEFAIQKIG